MNHLDHEIDKIKVDESSPNSDREAVSLAFRAEKIVASFTDRLPHRHEIEEMTRIFGHDVVQVALALILTRVQPNRFFYEHVETYLRTSPDLRPSAVLHLDQRNPEPLTTADLQNPYELTIVASSTDSPHRKWGEHIAPWQKWGRLAGMQTQVIETLKSKTVFENANFIRDFLVKNPHERRILATVGQGSAEVRILVDQLLRNQRVHELFGVRAWINCAGNIHGSVKTTLRSKTVWTKAIDSVFQLMRRRSLQNARFLSSESAWLRPPLVWSGLPFSVISLVGFAGIGDIPLGEKKDFLELARNAPNDGMTLFSDSIVKPGYVLPIPHMTYLAENLLLAPWFIATLRAYKNLGSERKTIWN